jgi:hypothetical protein
LIPGRFPDDEPCLTNRLSKDRNDIGDWLPRAVRREAEEDHDRSTGIRKVLDGSDKSVASFEHQNVSL